MPEETPQLLLELLALGELPDAESESLRDALAQDGDARLDEIATSNAAILERYPPAMIGARLRQRLVPPQVASTPWRMCPTWLLRQRQAGRRLRSFHS